MDIISAKDLLLMHLPHVPQLVEGLIGIGVVLLAGPPKSGKSFFCLSLAKAISCGEPFLGLPTTKGKVLYLALEDTKARLQKRLQALYGTATPEDGIFMSIEASPLGDSKDNFADEIQKVYKENPGLRLIIVDTLQMIRSNYAPKGRTAYEADYPEMARLKKLSRDLNVAILLVHHTNKPTATNTGDIFHSINGSTALMGAVDTTILLQKDRDNPIATFHVTGREVEAKKIWASFKDGKWSAATPDAGKALEKKVDMSSAEAQEAYRNSPLASFIRQEAVSSGVKKTYKQLKESHPSLKLRDTWMIKKDIEALRPFFSQDRICIRVGVPCSGNQKGIFIQATIPPNAVQTTMATP